MLQNFMAKEYIQLCLTLREPSQITFAFRGGQVVRKMLNLLHKSANQGGQVRGQMPKNANVICEGSLTNDLTAADLVHADFCHT